MTTERAEQWVDQARSVRADRLIRWRERAVRRVLGPVDPPDDVADVVRPVAWLLGHAADGIELTQSRYIARAVVVEAAETFGWWDWDKPPRSEADLFQLGEVREAATERRWVRRKGRTLVITAAGRRVLADPAALWAGLAETMGGRGSFDRALGELMAHRLLDGPATDDELVDAVGPVIASLGWRTESGPLSSDDVRSSVWDRWRWWRILGAVVEEPSVWDRTTHEQLSPRSTSLTPAGEATVLTYLRGRAIGPRHDVRP